MHEFTRHKLIHKNEDEEKTRQAQMGKKKKPRKRKQVARKETKKQVGGVESVNLTNGFDAKSTRTPYKCQTCVVVLKTIDEVKKHATSACKFFCDTCNITYNTMHGFNIHILQHKIDSVKPRQEYSCEECSMAFFDVIQLRCHTFLEHSKRPNADLKGVKVEKQEIDENDEVREVNITINDIEENDELTEFVIGKTVFENDTGGVEDKFDIKDVIIEEETLNYAEYDASKLTCDLCYDVFMTSEEFSEHMELHKQLTNDQDDKSTVLVEANYTVAEEPPEEETNEGDATVDVGFKITKPNDIIPHEYYTCKKCYRIFLTTHEYDMHVSIKCTIIEECRECPEKFKNNWDFYKHYLVKHIDVFICEFCYAIIIDKNGIDDHKLSHLKSMQNVCKICVRMFKNYAEFDKHLKEHLKGDFSIK